MKTRALSALVLVPVLLIALLIGLPAITAVLVVVVALGAWEVFRLLKMAGYQSLPLFGTALAIAFVLEAAFQPVGDKGILLVAIGVVLAGVGAFSRQDPRDAENFEEYPDHRFELPSSDLRVMRSRRRRQLIDQGRLTRPGRSGNTDHVRPPRTFEERRLHLPRAPGMVLRCPHCEAVLAKLSTDGERVWLDLRGVRSLEVRV